MAKQRIDGDGNIQVARVEGDLSIVQDEPFDPDNPNLTDCPSCWKPASRYASLCPRCGYNIVGHFAALEREERRNLVFARAKVCGLLAVGLIVLLNLPWLPASWKGYLSIAAMACAFCGIALGSAAEKLR